MKLGAFIIHLESAHTRSENVRQLISNCPIPARIHPAIDGTLLTDHKIAKVYKRDLHLPTYPFTLNAGEIGCFLSYRSVWMRMLDEKIDVALIIEDDIQINLDIFNNVLSFAIKHIMELGYIKFPIKIRKQKYRIIKCANHLEICEHVIIPSGTVCQLVSSKAVNNMLSKTDYIDRPIDTFQQLRHISKQRIYSMFPNGISEISIQLSGSIIHSPRISSNTISREWKRYKYRKAIKSLSTESFLELK